MPDNCVDFALRESADIDDQATMLATWDQTYVQFGTGRFHAGVQAAYLTPEYGIFRKQTNRKLHKMFAAPHELVAIAVQLPGSDRSLFQGAPTGAGDILLIPGNWHLDLSCHGNFDVVVATVPRSMFSSEYEQGAARLEPRIIKGFASKLFGRWLTTTLQRVLQEGRGAIGADDIADISGEMRSRFANILGGDQGATQKPMTRTCQAVHIVQEARDIIDRSIGMDENVLTVSEIAARVGVSLRTLEYSFVQVFGVTPQHYVKCQRLRYARRDLRVMGAKTSVTEIAMKWGFWHLGRFSGSYSDLFGELPSETLRRCPPGQNPMSPLNF